MTPARTADSFPPKPAPAVFEPHCHEKNPFCDTVDVSPDPIVEGSRIRAWKVRVRFDGNRECETEITVREGGDIVAQARRVNLRPGVNEIDLRPTENYRFRGREHCFNVQVDLEGSRREVDAARRFCAQQRPAWSMREPGDRSASFR